MKKPILSPESTNRLLTNLATTYIHHLEKPEGVYSTSHILLHNITSTLKDYNIPEAQFHDRIKAHFANSPQQAPQ